MQESACICHFLTVYLGMKNKDKINNMRDYTINNDMTIKNGVTHEYKGKKYTRSYIGGAAFDHEVEKWEDNEYGGKMWELYRTDRRAYYKKYHSK